jgi:hypothetical protein
MLTTELEKGGTLSVCGVNRTGIGCRLVQSHIVSDVIACSDVVMSRCTMIRVVGYGGTLNAIDID